jgi:hypothetical protein
VLEHHSSLPEAGALGRLPRGCVAAIWDLALTADAETSGAIVGLAPAFAGETSVRDLSFERRWTPPAFSELALCQLERWRELSTVQRSVLERTWTGLREAAGLVVPVGAALFAGCSLSGAVPVQVPEEIDPATFYAYVLREGTPVSWLTLARPVHFGVVRVSGAVAARQAAERLARWMLIPAGPRDTQTDIEQAVLGVVKAAEYLGVRWRTEPARAAAYATLLDEWYGSGHDAFRPIFPTETQSGVADFSW